MTMAASALSSIINQPHIKLHSPSCFTTLRFFKHINKPLSSTSSPRPLHHITASRTFSISNKSSEQPSLRHFVARASLTASQLQPQWVLIAISVFCFLIIYHNLLQFQWKIKKIIFFNGMFGLNNLNLSETVWKKCLWSGLGYVHKFILAYFLMFCCITYESNL
jgi:hypothetical protein